MTSTLRLLRPTRSILDRALAEAETRPFSYSKPNPTETICRPGFRQSTHTTVLGTGEAVFERAVAALGEWRMFDVPWVVLYPDRPVIRDGLTVIVAARALGLWFLNPTRIVSVLGEHDEVGFYFRTLEGHSAQGEERFSVNRDTEGTVRYQVSSHSQLSHPLARALPPVARRIQDRFATTSAAALQRTLRG